jgi:hypothetical protein
MTKESEEGRKEHFGHPSQDIDLNEFSVVQRGGRCGREVYSTQCEFAVKNSFGLQFSIPTNQPSPYPRHPKKLP